MSRAQLAEQAPVNVRTIRHAEAGDWSLIPATTAASVMALESAGIEFTEDGGVRPRQKSVHR
jgi:hypothetical protein